MMFIPSILMLLLQARLPASLPGAYWIRPAVLSPACRSS
jgi:hypothetical protein